MNGTKGISSRAMSNLAAAFLAASTAVGMAAAQPIAIVNPSFETDFAADGRFRLLIPAGWQLLDPGGIVNQNANSVGVLNPIGTTYFPAGSPDGRNAALIFLQLNPGGTPVSLRQVLGATLPPNTRYTLRVAVGNIASGTDPVFGFFDLDGFPGYSVQLRAGGQMLAEDLDSLTIPEGTFATTTVHFTTGATHPQLGQPLEIRLTNLNQIDTPMDPGIEVDFDNVQLSAAPTPPCIGDFNRDGGPSVQDIFDFLAAYFAGDPSADINGGGLSVQDIFDFLAAYFAGCP